jgi:two-component system, OmpR family, response regulator AdeR
VTPGPAVPSRTPADDRREAVIILVESDVQVGRELVEELEADRYRAVLAGTAEHARSLARAQSIRALVLGTLDAPRGALDLLEEVRSSSSDTVWDERLPVIVLSPSAGQLDLLRAFEMGADDFIARLNPGRAARRYLELRARLKAVLRRVEEVPDPPVLRIGPLEIDVRAHVVRVGPAPVELCRLEYDLLVHLARNPTGVCSKQELLRAIWSRSAGDGARTVDSHASRLRRKLGAAGAPGLVVNVWGIGYRLI